MAQDFIQETITLYITRSTHGMIRLLLNIAATMAMAVWGTLGSLPQIISLVRTARTRRPAK